MFAQVGRTWKAEDVQPVIESDDHDILRVCQVLAIVERTVSISDREAYVRLAMIDDTELQRPTPSIEEYKHVFSRFRRGRFRPYVECQTVFILWRTRSTRKVLNDTLSLWNEAWVIGGR